jgi:hypothetical protein
MYAQDALLASVGSTGNTRTIMPLLNLGCDFQSEFVASISK